jgi:uncharacterized protein (TIGR02996 family)
MALSYPDAFLQAICEAPEDDAPRLIFADWLDEHGEPDRAEFIRLQIELESTPEDSDRWLDLKARAEELRERYRESWAQPFPEENSYYVSEWRRGFPDSIHISAPQLLKIGQGLFARIPARRAKIEKICEQGYWDGQDQEWSVAAELADCPALARLQGLCIREHFMEWGGDITNSDVLSPEDLRRLLHSPHLGNLIELTLELPIGPAGAQDLAESAPLASLQRLELRSANLGLEGVAALVGAARLNHLQCLTRLSIARKWSGSTANIGAGGIDALAEASFLEQLTHLDLEGNELPLDSLSGLLSTRRLTSLKRLDLSHTGCAAIDLIALGNLPLDPLSGMLPRLTHLSLRSMWLGASDIEALARSPLFAQLLELDLTFNNVGDAGANALADTPHPPRLRVLHLHDCDLTDAGATALAKAPCLAEVRVLYLKQNQITAAGARALAESPVLHPNIRIHLEGNPVSKAEALALSKRIEATG